MTKDFAKAFLSALLLCSPAAAQYIDIETHSDYRGICGAPGHRGCALAPTCTAPSANKLRDDKYTGKVLCDLPERALLSRVSN